MHGYFMNKIKTITKIKSILKEIGIARLDFFKNYNPEFNSIFFTPYSEEYKYMRKVSNFNGSFSIFRYSKIDKTWLELTGIDKIFTSGISFDNKNIVNFFRGVTFYIVQDGNNYFDYNVKIHSRILEDIVWNIPDADKIKLKSINDYNKIDLYKACFESDSLVEHFSKKIKNLKINISLSEWHIANEIVSEFRNIFNIFEFDKSSRFKSLYINTLIGVLTDKHNSELLLNILDDVSTINTLKTFKMDKYHINPIFLFYKTKEYDDIIICVDDKSNQFVITYYYNLGVTNKSIYNIKETLYDNNHIIMSTIKNPKYENQFEYIKQLIQIAKHNYTGTDNEKLFDEFINKNGLEYYLKPELHHEFKEFIIEEEND